MRRTRERGGVIRITPFLPRFRNPGPKEQVQHANAAGVRGVPRKTSLFPPPGRGIGGGEQEI
jgi:hypothetical protein